MDLRAWVDDVERRDWAEAESGTLRLALIGLGWWTVDFAIPAIEDTDRCETTVLVSSTEGKATRIAAENDIEYGISYDAFHDGAAADAYDAIYIGTPNAYHRVYAETAAELGKAVLCEKPIAADLDDAERMIAATDDAGVPFMGAYRMQTDPIVRRARELIDGGAIGEPRFVYGTNSQPLLGMIPDPDQWRLDPDLTGYGTSVMDLGIYVINTARFLLRADPVTAMARMESTHEAFADVPDEWASFELQFPDGVSVLGTASQHAQRNTSLRITGTEGELALAPAFHGEVRLHVARGDVSSELYHDDIDGMREMTEEFDYFADRVLTGGEIEPDGAHSVVDIDAIRAIHEAAERERPVAIDRASY